MAIQVCQDYFLLRLERIWILQVWKHSWWAFTKSCGTIWGSSTIRIIPRNKNKILWIMPQCSTIWGCSLNWVNMVIWTSTLDSVASYSSKLIACKVLSNCLDYLLVNTAVDSPRNLSISNFHFDTSTHTSLQPNKCHHKMFPFKSRPS